MRTRGLMLSPVTPKNRPRLKSPPAHQIGMNTNDPRKRPTTTTSVGVEFGLDDFGDLLTALHDW
jgi:hypothetical protein